MSEVMTDSKPTTSYINEVIETVNTTRYTSELEKIVCSLDIDVLTAVINNKSVKASALNTFAWAFIETARKNSGNQETAKECSDGLVTIIAEKMLVYLQ